MAVALNLGMTTDFKGVALRNNVNLTSIPNEHIKLDVERFHLIHLIHLNLNKSKLGSSICGENNPRYNSGNEISVEKPRVKKQRSESLWPSRP